MKQLEVQIMGQNYMLGCPQDSEARLLEAVNSVDAAMCKIRDAGKVKARDRIAVLAALNLAYQLLENPPPKATVQSMEGAVEGSGDASRAQLQSLLEKLDAALARQHPAA